jgi:hypothetical protein
MHAQDTANASFVDDELVLVDLPSGECAWLRPEHRSVRITGEVGAHWSPVERAGITELGRDYLARERAFEALFGPWPTIAEACGLKQNRVA